MPTVYKTSDDAELRAVSKLTAILADLRSGPGDTVCERALIYAAARAGIQVAVITIAPLPAIPPAASSHREPAPDLAYPCERCERRFVSERARTIHMSIAHIKPDRQAARTAPAPSAPQPPPHREPAPDPEPLPFEERPARYPCPHCGKEFLTPTSCFAHTARCPVTHPRPAPPAPDPITIVGEPPHSGTLDYLWRRPWPRPCPECWRAGTRWEAAGPRAMADHRFHAHGVPMDAGHRLIQSLATKPAAPSTDASGWHCAVCTSAAFARYRDSDTCVRCHARATAAHAGAS